MATPNSESEVQFGPLIDLEEEEMERALADTWRKSTPANTKTESGYRSATGHNEALVDAVEQLGRQFMSHSGRLTEEVTRLYERMEAFDKRIAEVENCPSPVTTSSTPAADVSEGRPDEMLQALETIEKLAGQKQTSQKPRVRPSTYDGKASWEDYLAQFELVAEINGWNNSEKAIHLAVSLGDKARTTLGDLSAAERKDFKALTSTLSSRFGTENRTELFRMTLKTRSRKRDESLPELAQAIRRLTRLAYPDVPAETRGTMAQDFFVDALRDSDARWKLRQARPKSLDEALTLAVELEAFRAAERDRTGPGAKTAHAYPEEPQEACRQSTLDLQKEIEDLKAHVMRLSSGRGRPDRSCWNCGRMGHFRHQCPEGQSQRADQTNQPAGNANLPGSRA